MPIDDFDGLALAIDRPYRHFLTHPVSGERLINRETGEPGWIDILGGDSAKARDLRVERERKMREENAQPPKTADEIDAVLAATAAHLTVAWSLCALDGTPMPIPCTPENCTKFFTSPALRYISEPLIGEVYKRANFLPGGTSSSPMPATNSTSAPHEKTAALSAATSSRSSGKRSARPQD